MTKHKSTVLWLVTLALGWAGGTLFVYLNTPLPWMIGPLVFTAVARFLSAPLVLPASARSLGQFIIGVALGLYFSPEVVSRMGQLMPLVLLAAFSALVLGALAGKVLARISGVDFASAYFSAMPGGASEMANLAERQNARPDLVAAAHSLRVMVVVMLIPTLYVGLDLHGQDASQAAPGVVDVPMLSLITALGVVAALLWRGLKQANAWIIGPLVAAAIFAGQGHALAIPGWITAAGQLFIGCSLGCRFSPQFIREAPRFLLASLLVTLCLMGATSLFGAALAVVGGLNVPATILGLAPGGIAEMCITAKVLQLGVPMVTLFHVVRAMVVVVFAAPFYHVIRRRSGDHRD